MCVDYRLGKVVNIIAKVNRAFTSSMEVGGLAFACSIMNIIHISGLKTAEFTDFCSYQVGILVTCEDLYTDRQWKICHAFATFVARRTEAGKVGETTEI